MCSWTIFQDLGFIAVAKGFHNSLSSDGCLCLFNVYYFEIYIHHCHFLANYEMGFPGISVVGVLVVLVGFCYLSSS